MFDIVETKRCFVALSIREDIVNPVFNLISITIGQDLVQAIQE